MDIIRRLNEASIRYLVVGGVAVNMHGVPRMTYDLDLLVDLEDENLRAMLTIFQEWGFEPKVPVGIMDLADGEKRREWIEDKNMKAFSLVNEEWAVSEIDLIIDAPIGYADAIENSVTVEVDGVGIPVVCVADLIRMKEGTGRAQDAADIRYLAEVGDDS